MTWPDVIRSVTARIHDVAAQDRELRVLYREERMVGFEPDSAIICVVHCGLCHWDSGFLSDSAADDGEPYCLHCGAADPEVIEVRRVSARPQSTEPQPA